MSVFFGFWNFEVALGAGLLFSFGMKLFCGYASYREQLFNEFIMKSFLSFSPWPVAHWNVLKLLLNLILH